MATETSSPSSSSPSSSTTTPTSGDLYAILNVDRNASLDQSKRVISEMVLVYPPDKGGDPKKFADLQNAYKILFDEKKRGTMIKPRRQLKN